MHGLYTHVNHRKDLFRRVAHIKSQADDDLLADQHDRVKEEGPPVADETAEHEELTSCTPEPGQTTGQLIYRRK